MPELDEEVKRKRRDFPPMDEPPNTSLVQELKKTEQDHLASIKHLAPRVQLALQVDRQRKSVFECALGQTLMPEPNLHSYDEMRVSVRELFNRATEDYNQSRTPEKLKQYHALWYHVWRFDQLIPQYEDAQIEFGASRALTMERMVKECYELTPLLQDPEFEALFLGVKPAVLLHNRAYINDYLEFMPYIRRFLDLRMEEYIIYDPILVQEVILREPETFRSFGYHGSHLSEQLISEIVRSLANGLSNIKREDRSRLPLEYALGCILGYPKEARDDYIRLEGLRFEILDEIGVFPQYPDTIPVPPKRRGDYEKYQAYLDALNKAEDSPDWAQLQLEITLTYEKMIREMYRKYGGFMKSRKAEEFIQLILHWTSSEHYGIGYGYEGLRKRAPIRGTTQLRGASAFASLRPDARRTVKIK